MYRQQITFIVSISLYYYPKHNIPVLETETSIICSILTYSQQLCEKMYISYYYYKCKAYRMKRVIAAYTLLIVVAQ